VGFFIALSLWFVPSKNKDTIESDVAKKLRKIADLTFPIYVLHYPLLVLYRVFCYHDLYDSMQMWQAIGVVLIFCVVLGLLIESQRFFWIQFFKYLFSSGRKVFNLAISFRWYRVR